MTFTEYVELFLAALYHKTTLEDGDWYKFADIVEEYRFPWRDAWAENLMDDLEDRGLARLRRPSGPYLEQGVSLSGPGFRHIELGRGVDNVATFLESYGLTHSDQRQYVDEGPKADGDLRRIESSKWTGLPTGFKLPEDRRRAIVRALDAAGDSLSDTSANQHDQAQARAYIIAAKALLEAPDPEPDLAWELINRANQLAGIASLFVSIIALFAAT